MALPPQHLPVLQAAHGGDVAAMAQLLRLCRPDIRRYAQRHCLISDVDDAVQEALLVLARRLHSLRVLAALSGWLFLTVQRECRRLGRVALRYDPYDETQVEHWVAGRNNDELRLDLSRALQSLPVHYREVLLLRDFEELSMVEIAERLGLTVAAAKSRLHRAREMAREYLLA
ncbi:RNA polymerase sigma factor [Roseateles toxinivorans]|uniref:RNA polymerase sigma factor (Sigma-70 family) n=1 Tax=Roseateles toxinivorans TaxID=270368 RepID=A0A4R6QRD9_9BURK|nr:sigma-70 family RNA polymerase sigma factor [Roseateles toxinivorans]TDP72765.1 RNA polymerase sigma factor (sigma-70 family) [Roseateles toxinivorans]